MSIESDFDIYKTIKILKEKYQQQKIPIINSIGSITDTFRREDTLPYYNELTNLFQESYSNQKLMKLIKKEIPDKSFYDLLVCREENL